MSACVWGLGLRVEGFRNCASRAGFGVFRFGHRIIVFVVVRDRHSADGYIIDPESHGSAPPVRSTVLGVQGPGFATRSSRMWFGVHQQVWECCAPRRYDTNSAEFHTNTFSGRCQHPLPVPRLLPSPTTTTMFACMKPRGDEREFSPGCAQHAPTC